MSNGKLPSASMPPADPADSKIDESRRYWKAAIAHLAPEKREAAWEFYLDRLESSPAADTLGGLMLLLEAHMAFFDDLPVRLGQAAQQIEAALKTPAQPGSGGVELPTVTGPPSASTPRPRRRAVLVAGVSAVIGGAAVYVALLMLRYPSTPDLANTLVQTNHFLFTRAESIRVQSWIEPTTHRQQGSIVSFGSVAWTERTSNGGANIYVLSPAEEVRRDLEALRRASK